MQNVECRSKSIYKCFGDQLSKWISRITRWISFRKLNRNLQKKIILFIILTKVAECSLDQLMYVNTLAVCVCMCPMIGVCECMQVCFGRCTNRAQEFKKVSGRGCVLCHLTYACACAYLHINAMGNRECSCAVRGFVIAYSNM